jgi:hypothetical protein
LCFVFQENISALMFQSLLYNSMNTLSNWSFENTHRLEAEYYYLEWRLSSYLFDILPVICKCCSIKTAFWLFPMVIPRVILQKYLVHQRNCLVIVFFIYGIRFPVMPYCSQLFESNTWYTLVSISEILNTARSRNPASLAKGFQ